MADKRTTGLASGAASELNTLLSTLKVICDDPSYAEAKGFLWNFLLNNGPVTSNTNNYQALTPKGFYDSVASESAKGVVELASDTEITDKVTANVMSASKQGVMQTQWLKDWFEKNNKPVVIYTNSLSTPYSMAFFVAYSNTMTNGFSVVISPTLPANTRFNIVQVSWVLTEGGVGAAASKYAGTESFGYSGSQEEIILYSLIGENAVSLILAADGRSFAVKANNVTPNIRVNGSFTINAILETY